MYLHERLSNESVSMFSIDYPKVITVDNEKLITCNVTYHNNGKVNQSPEYLINIVLSGKYYVAEYAEYILDNADGNVGNHKIVLEYLNGLKEDTKCVCDCFRLYLILLFNVMEVLTFNVINIIDMVCPK